MQKEKKEVIVLFDGVCNMCNGYVNFLIDRDHRKILKFASLQSTVAKENLENFGVDNTYLSSIIVIKNNSVYKNSRAILEIFLSLGGVYKVLYCFIIIPRFIRDFIYKIIAKNRYKWFGVSDTCRMPTDDIRERFL